jgi:Recombination endonuclease VII
MFRLKKYGLNTLDWLRQMAFQHDKCYICRKTFTHKRRPCNDHRHSDGLYRGLLCEGCNTMLGILHDDADWCYWAYHYLKNPPALDALDGPRYAADSPPQHKAPLE